MGEAGINRKKGRRERNEQNNEREDKRYTSKKRVHVARGRRVKGVGRPILQGRQIHEG